MVLRDQTGEELAPGVQGVDMDGVAVMGEQLGQAALEGYQLQPLLTTP